ncbi:MAG: c-type cytochrome [Halarcobacter sp.]
MNKKLLIIIFSSLSLFAQTTMCYKENVTSMSGIDDIKLDGGDCQGDKSLNDMKELGWSVDDINITKANKGMNYIYILKNETQYSKNDIDKIEQKIVERLEKKKVEDKKRRIKEIKIKMSREGKVKYVQKCQSCHGEKGEVEYRTSRAINTLSLQEFITTIRDYDLRQYDRGQAIVMYPYANVLDSSAIKNVYLYLESLKPKKEETK